MPKDPLRDDSLGDELALILILLDSAVDLPNVPRRSVSANDPILLGAASQQHWMHADDGIALTSPEVHS